MGKVMLFFFNDTATTEIYSLSRHDALPISIIRSTMPSSRDSCSWAPARCCRRDRKSTRLNSSHLVISYAVFCLKKKMQIHAHPDGAGVSGLPDGWVIVEPPSASCEPHQWTV